MKNFTQQLSLAALLVLGSTLTFADSVTIQGQASPTWQQGSASQLQNNGTPYWDNLSWDGTNKNLGFCLNASSNCGINNAPGLSNLSYLTNSTGAAPANFFFNNSGSPVTATFDTQIAGNAPYDAIGWYDVNNPGVGGLLFSGVTAAGTNVTFDPSAEYGLFYINAGSDVQGLYLSQSDFMLNGGFVSTDPGNQHFAVFEDTSSNFYVGAEDLPFSNSDKDFNDTVIELSSSSCPEPGSTMLLAAGLLALAALRFGRTKSAWPNN